jgi:hypothetical protein
MIGSIIASRSGVVQWANTCAAKRLRYPDASYLLGVNFARRHLKRSSDWKALGEAASDNDALVPGELSVLDVKSRWIAFNVEVSAEPAWLSLVRLLFFGLDTTAAGIPGSGGTRPQESHRRSKSGAVNPLDACAFNEVARTLSFTETGKILGLSRSAISRKITRLEEALGAVLLARTTRQFQLTEAGRTFFKYSKKVDRDFERAITVVRDSDSSPVGTLVLSIPSSPGPALTPALTSEFCVRWPKLNLGIHFDDRPVDIIHQRYDFRIYLVDRLADSSLIIKRLGSTRKLLLASMLQTRIGTSQPRFVSCWSLSKGICRKMRSLIVGRRNLDIRQKGLVMKNVTVAAVLY